jgi:hypothetical protein
MMGFIMRFGSVALLFSTLHCGLCFAQKISVVIGHHLPFERRLFLSRVGFPNALCSLIWGRPWSYNFSLCLYPATCFSAGADFFCRCAVAGMMVTFIIVV